MTIKNYQKISRSFLATIIPCVFIVALLWFLGQTQEVALAQVGTGTIRVATSGVDTTGCGSEVTPCRTIQYAVDLAQDGDEVLVASGVYTSNQIQVVYINDAITLRGGYTITDWTVSDPVANPTRIDARGLGRGIYISTDSPTIEGMQIISGTALGLGGYTIGPSTYDAGGGIYSSSTASITLLNNLITGNGMSYVEYGAGIFISRGMPYLEGNDIYSNTGSYGGGIFAYRSSITLIDNNIAYNEAIYGAGVHLQDPATPNALIRNNSIFSNDALLYGGGVYWEFTSPTLENNLIYENTAERGAGIYGNASGAGDTYIYNNLITGNQASAYGGGTYLTGGTPHFDKNHVFGNSASTRGGGLYINSWGTFTNNFIVDNQSGGNGGGVTFEAGGYISPPSPSFINNTVAQNTGDNGVYVGYGAAPDLSNTIIAGHNTGIRLGFSNSTANLDATLWYNNTTNWSSAGTLSRVNDLFGNPDFLSPGTGDYHIGLNSLAMDQGVVTSVADDFDGEPRPQGFHYDIGADETGFVVTKQSDPSEALGGAPLTYTIRVTNYTHLALPTTITDTLPLQVVPGGSVTWSPTIPASGGVWTATFVVTPDINYSGYLTNTVRVSTPVGASAAYTLTTPCTPPMPDLQMIKSATPSTAIPGLPIAYTLTYQNNGTFAAAQVLITDVITAGISVSGIVSSGALITNTSPAPNLAWDVQDLAIGQGGIITITGIVSSEIRGDSVLTNTAIITSTTPDANPADNRATVSSPVSDEIRCGISTSSYLFNTTYPVRIDVDDPGTLACITVERFDTDHPNATTGVQTGHYWSITGNDTIGNPASGFTVTLTLPGDFVPTNTDKVCRYTGVDTIWDCAANGFDIQNNTITRNNVTMFSDWALGQDVGPTAFSVNRVKAQSAETSIALVGLSLLGLITLSAKLLIHLYKHRKVF